MNSLLRLQTKVRWRVWCDYCRWLWCLRRNNVFIPSNNSSRSRKCFFVGSILIFYLIATKSRWVSHSSGLTHYLRFFRGIVLRDSRFLFLLFYLNSRVYVNPFIVLNQSRILDSWGAKGKYNEWIPIFNFIVFRVKLIWVGHAREYALEHVHSQKWRVAIIEF